MSKLFTPKNLLGIATMLCAILSAEMYAQTQEFTTVGSSTFTVPASVVSLRAECVGGGGGGGRVTPSNPFDKDAAGGGGGGAYASALVPVTAGNTYDLFVGVGGSNTGSSVNGGNSYFGDGTRILAEGGKTRSGNDELGGAEGGKLDNSIGTIKYNGGNGGNGDEGDVNGGGGGGAAGSTGNGYAGAGLSGGGLRANYGGYGGSGGADGATGSAGGNYGGAGGGSSANGSSDRNGGPGASGIVVLTWSEISSFSPTSLCASGTSTVVVTGSNFVGVDSVFINGLSVPFVVDNDTQITIAVPANATSGEIVVSTVNGKSKTLSPLAITSNTVSVSLAGTQLTAQYSGNSSASFQWLNCIQGNAPISGANASTYTPTQSGLYAVTISENGCTVTSACQTVTVNNNGNVGIDESDLQNLGFSIYPNPSHGSCHIISQYGIMNRVRILGLTGVQYLSIQPNTDSAILDLSNVASGIYIVEILGDGFILTKRLVIDKK